MLLNWNRKSNVCRLLWLKNPTQKQVFSVMTFLKNITSFTWTETAHTYVLHLYFLRELRLALVWVFLGICLLLDVTIRVLLECLGLNVVCRPPAKKSARPTTSSCAPSVTSTAPTWDCQTAASTPRYTNRGTKCSQQLILVIVADLSVS